MTLKVQSIQQNQFNKNEAAQRIFIGSAVKSQHL